MDDKNALCEFAEGHPFDNDREMQITRYFGKARNALDRGKELTKGDPNIVTHEWMRYAEYHLI